MNILVEFSLSNEPSGQIDKINPEIKNILVPLEEFPGYNLTSPESIVSVSLIYEFDNGEILSEMIGESDIESILSGDIEYIIEAADDYQIRELEFINKPLEDMKFKVDLDGMMEE